MKHKDYEPINFRFFQTDMEKIVFILDAVIYVLEKVNENKLKEQVIRIKKDLQHKINCHKEKGEWF